MSDATDTPETAVCPLCNGTKTLTVDATTTAPDGTQTTAPMVTACPRCHATGRVPPELATL